MDVNTLSAAAQDRAGHVWAAVWNAALGRGVAPDIAKALADAAQQAALEMYEAA